MSACKVSGLAVTTVVVAGMATAARVAAVVIIEIGFLILFYFVSLCLGC